MGLKIKRQYFVLTFSREKENTSPMVDSIEFLAWIEHGVKIYIFHCVFGAILALV
jgi:hypothetical protein